MRNSKHSTFFDVGTWNGLCVRNGKAEFVWLDLCWTDSIVWVDEIHILRAFHFQETCVRVDAVVTLNHLLFAFFHTILFVINFYANSAASKTIQFLNVDKFPFEKCLLSAKTNDNSKKIKKRKKMKNQMKNGKNIMDCLLFDCCALNEKILVSSLRWVEKFFRFFCFVCSTFVFFCCCCWCYHSWINTKYYWVTGALENVCRCPYIT